MMATSNTQSYGASILPKTFQPSVSRAGKFCSSSISSSSSTSPTMSSPPNRISDKWGPPLVRINRGCVSASTSVRVQVDHRNASTDRSVASSSSRERSQSGNHVNNNKASNNEQKKMCMCSPTSATNPKAFRCSLHRSESAINRTNSNSSQLSYQQWHRLYARRSAMTNSIVRIGTVEGDLEKRALASLISIRGLVGSLLCRKQEID
ncbi:unnamed protein product [Lactuca virosa]|uniref:Serine-rich protein n=1 Tax=Lactuca virosa TaxID=75947 RepID=A0AAU9M8G4_9ASTR|nr:unnamed protein product [Lactuca virosa]